MSPGSAPRVTPEQVEAAVQSETYTVLPDGRTTVCQLTLYNNFTVEGSSACVSKENFDIALGQKYSRERALNKVWELLGFRLCEQLYRPALTTADAAADATGAPRPDWKEATPELLRPGAVPAPTEPYPQPVLGDQVFFYEHKDGRTSAPMIALIAAIHDYRNISVTVLAPNGVTHGRGPLFLLGPEEELAEVPMHYARRKASA